MLVLRLIYIVDVFPNAIISDFNINKNMLYALLINIIIQPLVYTLICVFTETPDRTWERDVAPW